MYGKRKFICPQCKTGTNHIWYIVMIDDSNGFQANLVDPVYLITRNYEGERAVSVCTFCNDFSLWKSQKLVYPDSNVLIPEPNDDLPYDIKIIYEEARNIFQKSSRSSAALLRLAMETMLSDLGYTKGRLVDKIDALVKSEGTNEELLTSAEIIRHYGNSSAHTGFINLNEDKEAAEGLFMILNIIADHMYTKKRRVKSLIERMPDSKRKQLEEKLEKVKKITRD